MREWECHIAATPESRTRTMCGEHFGLGQFMFVDPNHGARSEANGSRLQVAPCCRRFLEETQP